MIVNLRKILAPIKIKSALPPPPKTQNTPPLNEEFYGHGFFLPKERIFPGAHKIGTAISGPRIADKNSTDTRLFLKITNAVLLLAQQGLWNPFSPTNTPRLTRSCPKNGPNWTENRTGMNRNRHFACSLGCRYRGICREGWR